MCTTVYTDDEAFETVGELRYLLGKDNIVANTSEPLSSRDCLCRVDVTASAEKAGWVAEKDAFGFKLHRKEMDHEFWRRRQAKVERGLRGR